MIVRSLLLALSALAGLPVSVSWQRATGPRLDNLTESEIKYAKIYWNYSAAERVLPGVQMSRDSQSKHGYRFVVPLPERLAGLTYVGHAARLRLVLERARNGTQSAYMSSCLHHHLPPEVDLVLVEYAANDSPAPRWTFADPNRRAMERLIRKLLGLASRPAVLLINMYAIGAAHGNYLHTAERDFMEFATYYSLPSVSLKAAVMPSAAVGGAEAVSYGAIFNGGHNHPGRGGHVLATELLITMCLDLLRRDAYALAQQPVDGWNWTDEGRGKWGYVATEPGKTIRFKVNTQLGGNRTKNRLSGRPIVVQVAYLESYQGMGTARVSCEAGCTCTAVTIDSYDKRPVSLTSMKDISVSQHPECILALTTKGPSKAAEAAALEAAARNETTSGDSSGSSNPDVEAAWSKFKVLGVVVGEEPGASEGGVTWLRDESHHLANALRDMRG
ncbi:hypothetical protein VOLCADRAFT_89684 [Volvox carteri f. nagariensis]|uniref:SGNH hydrolase-type esterase domain-containing protein n=1 Tax=Volvox carteri f. nagariensis TaxID=3068 RepID=D8TRT5_VOLCA|nr:uncharacterized protein VOLCADRAFT_89684 [Volvox carteri f. nagariensis]EFJ49701.1 hypothetical protein VOLCADRAFT_89684 [Volvox carteri f. nagariensis]|eukprot:XP_002949208.1 hypothetical protein VOLCADRAFT_89684 [Volvox carteri f. nagariensis]